MVGLELRGITKIFDTPDGRKTVLRDLDLSVSPSSVLAIRGDNGSGKTTLFNIIAGVERPSAGTVRFVAMTDESPQLGYTQQDYTSSLLPWLSVGENIAIPLRLRSVAASARIERVRHLLDSLRFYNLPLSAYPHQISGGQRQRVALARALIDHPHLLLLDEPFSNLDAHTSRDIQETLARIHEDYHPTILYAAHDLDQSILLADAVILLHGTPARVLHEFPISLARPRRRSLILTDEYSAIRTAILRFEEELYAPS
ncbi:MAG TPA: ATP-binding cassette domain-containing protein [Thermoanaerobaculia bacterium]|jgi:NitT/TauT family transport system ATP-binding protein|nr:ATP-binding cassette domain-containing protein [Thermoanaerobaculia bacterium]